MGACFVIDYAKSHAKREARQRITRGHSEISVESLFVFLCFLFHTKTGSPKILSIFSFKHLTLLIPLFA